MIFLAELRWFHEFGATKKYYFLLKRGFIYVPLARWKDKKEGDIEMIKNY